jgi:D-inositol-3-phosphate glycosyltransferase
MRILLVSSYFAPHVGGVEVVAQQQAAILAAAGHQVTVATTRVSPSLPTRERVGGQDGGPDGAGSYAVVRLPAVNVLEKRTGIPYPVVGPAFCAGLRELVRWSDVVHVHDVLYQPSQLAVLLAHREGRLVDLTQHVGLVDHDSRLVLRAQRITTGVAGRYVWRRARKIFAYNPMVYEHLRSYGVPAGRIVLTGNGVDVAAFAPGAPRDESELRRRLRLPERRPVVLFVGRLVPKKGYRELIAAAAADYHLVLVGPGRPPEQLPGGVSCLGEVPRSDLVELYRLADVFVLPSVGEMDTLAMQEAMACGLPVVTTDDPRYDGRGVDRELLSLVPAEPDALRRAIRTILGDDDLRARMGAYSRRLALERFDGAAHRQALLGLYGDDGADAPVADEMREAG